MRVMMRVMMRRFVAALTVGMLGVGGPASSLRRRRVRPRKMRKLRSRPAPGTYTLKVNTDIVLTNVVVRDKKTGAVVKDLKATDFTIFENNKPQKIVQLRLSERRRGRRARREEHCRRQGHHRGHAERNLAADAQELARPSPDRHVLRLQLHAGGRHRPRRRGRAGLRQQADAAGGPGRAGQPVAPA